MIWGLRPDPKMPAGLIFLTLSSPLLQDDFPQQITQHNDYYKVVPELGSEASTDYIVRGGHALDQLPGHVGMRFIGCKVDRLQYRTSVG